MNVVSPSNSFSRSVLLERTAGVCSSLSFALRNDSAIGPYNSSVLDILIILRSQSILTSGKSTQKAFMFRPYKKLAKSSLNRARLSCMSWKCIILASRSAKASESSAKAGSKVFNGNGSPPWVLRWADSRNEERDEGRRGVVGRDRDVERGRLALSCPSLADMVCNSFDSTEDRTIFSVNC